jgi:CheY-like chemotaxis protein
VEVRTADGTLFVLDCGTGIHDLGQALLASGERPVRGHLLITHTHWDHIQGLPFFAPLFIPGNEWDVYAPGGLGSQIEATLAGQMQYTYFPVTLDQLGATIRYHDLGEGSFGVGQVRVTAQYLNHPALAIGYRIECGGASVVYVMDHEPHVGPQTSVEDLERSASPMLKVHHEELRHITSLRDADLVIHDAQYTAREYAGKIGWGHTPAEWAVDYALAAGVHHLALTHHDPTRDDDAVDRILLTCQERVKTAGGTVEVFAAAEGQEIELNEAAAPPRAALPDQSSRTMNTSAGGGDSPTVLIADDDPDILRLLTLTLRPEGFRILTATNGEAALALARTERPVLLLLDWQMPGMDGLEVCQALREDADPALRDLPIVLITAQAGAENTAVGFSAGVTDYLTKPFTPAHVRSRVRAWVLRAGSQQAR